MEISNIQKKYWKKLSIVTWSLLLIWFLVSFVASYFADELSFNFFGWPFSFWLGAQGSMIVYLLIVWFYAKYVNQLDKEFEKKFNNE
jgi:putative solute:sodium symporter small subunit